MKLKSLLITGILSVIAMSASPAKAELIITGIFDGPLSGGVPKGIELYVTADIADLSIYGVGSANNGDGTDGEEFTLSGMATAGSFLYVASESTGFTNFFGFAPTFTTGAMGINGDDAVELFMNGNVIDTFGEPTFTGGPGVWNYADGWAYRISETGPDASFVATNWTFSGADALDGLTVNGPIPVGTYTAVTAIPEPGTFAVIGLIAGGAVVRRRLKAKKV